MKSHARLAWVPQPMAEESSLGYFVRLCQANAFDSRHILTTGVWTQFRLNGKRLLRLAALDVQNRKVITQVTAETLAAGIDVMLEKLNKSHSSVHSVEMDWAAERYSADIEGSFMKWGVVLRYVPRCTPRYCGIIERLFRESEKQAKELLPFRDLVPKRRS